MARPMAVVRDDDDTEEQMTRRLRDAAKEPGLIPTGVWELRSTHPLTVSDKEDKNGNPQKVVLAIHEPLEAGSNVDPEEVTAIDPETGMLFYDGKRIFTRYYLPRDYRRFAQFLLAHGVDEDVKLDRWGLPPKDVLEEFRGKCALGNVDIKPAREQWPADSTVKTWAQPEE